MIIATVVKFTGSLLGCFANKKEMFILISHLQLHLPHKYCLLLLRNVRLGAGANSVQFIRRFYSYIESELVGLETEILFSPHNIPKWNFYFTPSLNINLLQYFWVDINEQYCGSVDRPLGSHVAISNTIILIILLIIMIILIKKEKCKSSLWVTAYSLHCCSNKLVRQLLCRHTRLHSGHAAKFPILQQVHTCK